MVQPLVRHYMSSFSFKSRSSLTILQLFQVFLVNCFEDEERYSYINCVRFYAFLQFFHESVDFCGLFLVPFTSLNGRGSEVSGKVSNFTKSTSFANNMQKGSQIDASEIFRFLLFIFGRKGMNAL